MNKPQIEHLNQLGDELEKLNKPLNIAKYNAPVNRESEEKNLLIAHARGESYHPQFEYLDTPVGWEKPLEEFSKRLKPEHDYWEERIAFDVQETLNDLEAITHRDPNIITAKTVKIYGEVTDELLKDARDELATTIENPEARTIPSKLIADLMQEALIKAGLESWKITIDPFMSARMSVRSVEQEVKIREGELFTQAEGKRLLVHEIGTHVFRAVNGSHQPLRLLRMGLSGYLLAEEGLATYHEYVHGVRNIDDQRRYILRVIAAALSLRKGFYDVFTELTQHTTSKEAFEIVLRAKRGFRDTSVVGAHVKDIIYFKGFHVIKDFLQHNPEKYHYLMSGKVSLESLPKLIELDELGFLTRPKLLPDMLL